MKAVVASRAAGAAKQDLRFEAEYPKPTPGPDQILVKVIASAIQISDSLNVSGLFPHTTFPRIPGRDFAGTVAEPSTHRLHGKAVYGTSGPDLSFTADGAHAEYVVVADTAIAEMPSNISFVQAASVGVPFTTAYLALERAQAKGGETVMVLGATGAVGSTVVQLARLRGCNVVTVSRRDTTDINLKTDPELSTAKPLTAGRGPDVAVDTIGDLGLMHSALASLAKGGRLACITTAASKDTTELKVDIKMLYRLQHSIVGCNSVESSAKDTAEWLAGMKAGFESGELTPPDEMGLTKISIDEAVGAYEVMASPAGHGKKFVISFGEND